MASTSVADKPIVKQHGKYLKCDKCPAPLVGTWGTREGGDPGNRDDDWYLCLNCAGLQIAGKEPETYEGKAFISGLLVMGLIWALVTWLGSPK